MSSAPPLAARAPCGAREPRPRRRLLLELSGTPGPRTATLGASAGGESQRSIVSGQSRPEDRFMGPGSERRAFCVFSSGLGGATQGGGVSCARSAPPQRVDLPSDGRWPMMSPGGGV
eukprot:1694139-Prymnesium_polylepis.2